jgi:hypothetical protein
LAGTLVGVVAGVIGGILFAIGEDTTLRVVAAVIAGASYGAVMGIFTANAAQIEQRLSRKERPER